jgi:hypothetical protein
MSFSRSKFGTVTSQPSFFTNEFSITTTGLSLGGGSVVNLNSGVRIKANGANQDDVLIGTSTGVTGSNGFVLGADEEVFIDVDSLSKVYVISSGNGGDTLSFVGS